MHEVIQEAVEDEAGVGETGNGDEEGADSDHGFVCSEEKGRRGRVGGLSGRQLAEYGKDEVKIFLVDPYKQHLDEIAQNDN